MRLLQGLLCVVLFDLTYAKSASKSAKAKSSKTTKGSKSGDDEDPPAEYEPPCDTSRAERDAMRQIVLDELSGNPTLNEPTQGHVTLLQDVDPQGNTLQYKFPPPYGNDTSLFISDFVMHKATDATVYLYCNPPGPGPAHWAQDFYIVDWSLEDYLLPPLGFGNPNAEVGDALNQFRLNSTAKKKDSLPWGYTSAIIATPDETTYKAISDALVKAGLPERAINLYVIPSLLDMGDQGKDRLNFAIREDNPSVFFQGWRFRGWDDEEASALYASYEEPVIYFSGSVDSPGKPYPTPARLSRGGLNNEHHLKTSFDSLVEQVKQKVINDGYEFKDETTILRSPIIDPENCYFDFESFPLGTCFQGSQDICYGMAPIAPLTDQHGLQIAVGVVHTMTNMAEFSSFGYMRQNRNTRDLVGSAAAWMVEEEDSDKFYVLRVSKECEKAQTSIPMNGLLCLDFPGDGEGSSWVERLNLEKLTTTGPAFEDIIPAKILNFAKV